MLKSSSDFETTNSGYIFAYVGRTTAVVLIMYASMVVRHVISLNGVNFPSMKYAVEYCIEVLMSQFLRSIKTTLPGSKNLIGEKNHYNVIHNVM